ncbi:MAG: lycopene cyclase domain-containing protein [Saprospiraceae bacterium]
MSVHQRWVTNILVGLLLMMLLYFILKDVLITSPLIVSVPSFCNWQPAIPQMLYWYHHLFAFVPVLLIAIGRSIYRCQDGLNFRWFVSIFLGSIIFLYWDWKFTDLGIWGFNANYTMEDRWFGLPLEECFWFPVIGFCSIYIYVILRKVDLNKKLWNLVLMIWLLANVVLVIFYSEYLYTSFAAWAAIFVSVLAYWSGMKDEMTYFIRSFAVTLIPMVIFDGLLTGMMTGQAVVMYNPSEFSNFRLVSIPVEDFIFGYAFLLTIALFHFNINNRLSSN